MEGITIPSTGTSLKCLEPIGTFQKGSVIMCRIDKFTGRRYKNKEDKEGEKDNRMMVYGSGSYAVIDTPEQLNKHFVHAYE